ncbi:MAG TPA: hypothetical protein ENG29_00230 [Firmicutes bacterium]|nr:hypothetical protein [Bacillota bacterium]
MNEPDKKPGKILRHLFHIFGAIIPLGYLYIVPDRISLCKILLIVFAGSLMIDILRIFLLRAEDKGYLYRFLCGFMKEEEGWRFSGATYFIASSLIVIFYLPKNIAVSVLFFLSLGDPMATFVGSRIGEERLFWGDKSIEGSLAFFAVAFGIGVLFLGFMKGLLGAIIATLVETMPTHLLLGSLSHWLDDNLTVPLITGFLIHLLFSFI